MSNHEVWISVADAAALVDRTERQIRRYIESGRLPATQEKKPGSNNRHTLVQRASLLRLEPLAVNPARLIAGPAGGGAVAPHRGSAPPEEGEEQLAEVATSPWLTLEQAARLHPFPLPWLRYAAERGILDALQVLSGDAAQRWLVHRDCLGERALAERWRSRRDGDRSAAAREGAAREQAATAAAAGG